MSKFASFGQLVRGTPLEASVQICNRLCISTALERCSSFFRGYSDENWHVHEFASLYISRLVEYKQGWNNSPRLQRRKVRVCVLLHRQYNRKVDADIRAKGVQTPAEIPIWRPSQNRRFYCLGYVKFCLFRPTCEGDPFGGVCTTFAFDYV